jgi:cytochrome c oxidase subunit I
VKIFNWLATVWHGSVRLTTAMLFALGFIAMFTLGGLSGVLHSVVPADTQQTDTYFVVAHFHYVLFGGLVLAIFGGFYYWFPKLTGRFLDERLGKVNFWTMLVGFNLTFFPMHIVGLVGMPRRTYRYDDGLGWDFLNLLETIGSFVIALSVLVFIVNVVVSRRNGEAAGDDPWDARTLEWSIPSPPPEFNFAEIPEVEARDDFWHRKYTEDDDGRLVRLPKGGAVATTEGGAGGGPDEHGEGHGDGHHSEGEGIHMPSPSYFPFVMALGLPILGYGAVFKNFWFVPIGALVVLFGMYAWAIEPPTE